MADFDLGRRRIFHLLAGLAFTILLGNLFFLYGTDLRSKIKSIPISIPSLEKGTGKNTSPPSDLPKLPSWHEDHEKFEDQAGVHDNHPIASYMQAANEAWNKYMVDRSLTFRETVAKYRRIYHRHPPPGFKEWYKFARENDVHHIDDFEQIMDDLRPFWGVDPAIIRSYAAHLHEDEGNGVSGLHIRDGKVWTVTNANWRVETMQAMVGNFVKHLPDMDIAMNRLDQSRVVVPFEDMQALLAKEESTRQLHPEAVAEWTKDMPGLWNETDTSAVITDPGFFPAHGQQYMLIAKEGCPPDSHARREDSSTRSAELLYKDNEGGFITNFNLSSDLCTVGPEVQSKHGYLFAPSTIVASKKLLPIFGECKVNVNNDILFPANMYYKDDQRYAYDPEYDYDWDDKEDNMIWRGVTSGGTNTADNWRDMHRQRLVLLTNATVMASEDVRIMSESLDRMKGDYENFDHFIPSEFAKKYTDIGFTEAFACFPDCGFYDGVWTYKNMTTLSQQFESKYVIDVDGHSFSGRWHAFLQSKSLGIKSTIFREWHDSRLFAWRHFVPLDNRYDELYSILTYFIGLGNRSGMENGQAYVPRHDFEARKLGRQGREWAEKVLRKKDIEIYMFRLLIEYARIIDDNRDRLGYSGDGSELDDFDAAHPIFS